MMNPRVSIIMPSLNVAQYISDCISSVVSQTLNEIEIICVDAGSTDGTLEILKSFAEQDCRIQLLYSNQKSYGYQINMGLKKAKGDYIAIVETDDFVDSEMYEQLLLLAEINNADFVRSNFYNCIYGKDFPTNNFVNIRSNTLLAGEEIKKMTDIRSIWSVLYKKEFLTRNNISFTETPGASYQDTSFAFKTAICAERAVVTDRAFYHYRNDNPESSVHSAGKIYCVCDEVKEVKRFIDERFSDQNNIYELFAAFHYCTYLWNYLRLSLEYQHEFLEVMHREMLEDWNHGFILKSCFSPQNWNNVIAIVFNHEQFFWETSNAQNGTLNIHIYENAINGNLNSYNDIIIYGAGFYGKLMLTYLRNLNIKNQSVFFAVSNKTSDTLENIPCRCISDWIDKKENSLVIIAVVGPKQREMYENAKQYGFKNIFIMDNYFKKLIEPNFTI